MKKLLLLLLPSAMLFSCRQDESKISDGDDLSPLVMINENEAIQGVVRIKFKREFEDFAFSVNTRGELESEFSELDALMAEWGATRIEPVFAEGGKFKERRRKAGLHLWYDVHFDPEVPVTRALRDLTGLSRFEHIEPVYKIYSTGNGQTVLLSAIAQSLAPSHYRQDYEGQFPFDDPMLANQWHYHNMGTLQNSVMGCDVNLFNAWKVTAGHRDIIISVHDTGIDYTHEDLAANMWINEAELNGQSGVDDDGNGYVDDIYGYNFYHNTGDMRNDRDDHGTHVAGTISAVNNNGKGVSGIAGGTGKNDGVRLMSCQILYDRFGPQDDRKIADSYAYAADNGAVISTNSWVGGGTQSIYEGILYFIEHAGCDENGNQIGPMKGGLVIGGAGNDNMEIARFPAALDEVISVAALAPDYVVSYYSSYDETVNMSAPGGSASYYGKYGEYHMIASTIRGNNYQYSQGTSMATPHVTGVAALVVAHFGVGKPGLTPDFVRERLEKSCVSVDGYNPSYYGGKIGLGLVNAVRALLDDTGAAPKPTSDLTIEWSDTQGKLEWTVPEAQQGYPAAAFHLFYSENPFGNFDPGSPPQGLTEIVIPNTAFAGEKAAFNFIKPVAGDDYNVAMVSMDMFGNFSEITYIGQPLIDPDIHTPVKNKQLENITFDGIGDSHAVRVDLREYFSDPLGGALRYESDKSKSNVANISITESVMKIVPVTAGTTTVKVTAINELNLSVASTFTITVKDSNGGNGNGGGDTKIDLYPNPVKDILNIRIANTGSVRIIIHNTAGQKVYDNTFANGQNSVNLSNLSSGNYTVTLQYDGKKETRKIIKS